MDNKTWACSVSQAAVATFFAKHRAFVFTDPTGKAPFDMAVYKNGILRRVSVKSVLAPTDSDGGRGCATSYSVQLRCTRYSRSKIRTTNFSDADCDILATYVVPTDQVALFWSKDMVGRTAIDLSTVSGPRCKWVINEHQDADKFFASDEAKPDEEDRVVNNSRIGIITFDPVSKESKHSEEVHSASILGLNVIAVVSGTLCKSDCVICSALRRRIRQRTGALI
jgi:hypothetical protein